ncbi:hypothetical protein RQP46_009276 [Phenoliferia psychrophenolica]
MSSLKRAGSRKEPPPEFPALEPVVSHGVQQQPIAPADDILFPAFTTEGPHTDAFELETATGLVDAAEVESPITRSLTRASTHTRVGSAQEKGEKVKLNDPENPRNWSISAKWLNTCSATLLCFAGGFGSSVITGGLDPVARHFHVSNEIINLSVCVYVIGFGVGPLFFAPLSEVIGRRWVYLISFFLFAVFTVPSAVAKSAAVLIVFRFFAGCGASACMCLAAGSISDCWTPETRGYKMAAFSAILFASPCLGPPIGGYILLARRAKKMRAETGDSQIMTEQELHRRPVSEVVVEALFRPLVLLFLEPIMSCFSAYLCLIYGLLYGFFFAYPIVFDAHGFSYGQTGLCFFGILIGIAIVFATGCPIQERYYQTKLREGPETSWVGPAVAGIPFGFALIGIYISANTYLVDAFSRYSASAMAAKTFIRSMAGASMPMWIPYLYKGAGNHWAGSVLAFISVGMMPIPWVFFWYGARIRANSTRATS